MRFQLIATLVIISLLMLCAPGLWGADAAAAAEPLAVQGPWWAQLLVVVFSGILLPFAIKYLNQKAAAAEAAAADSTQSAKQKIVERVKAFIFREAEQVVEREIPKIAAQVAAGTLTTKDQVKTLLAGLGVQLKADAIAYFKTQDIDLIAEFGEEWVDSLIRTAADKLNPFIGQDTATALLKGGAQFILGFGVQQAKQVIFSETVRSDPKLGVIPQPGAEVPAAPKA